MTRYRAPRPPASKYITPDGARRLKAELDELWHRKRPEVTRAVAEAAAQGDRSENAEYIYGKKQLAEIDKRVRHLRKRLDGMRIVATTPADRNRVYFGAWFEIVDASNRAERHRIVGPDEIDHCKGYVSMDSPLGKAILGKELGAEVRIEAPDGSRKLIITKIEYD